MSTQKLAVFLGRCNAKRFSINSMFFSPYFIGPPFTTAPSRSSSSVDIPKEERKTSNCLRRFVSVHWELDPRIVLLATAQWASGHFNPHITWVLEMLGFKHARTTIPKYIQRGLMDPLDLGIAFVVELLIELSATKKLRTTDENAV